MQQSASMKYLLIVCYNINKYNNYNSNIMSYKNIGEVIIYITYKKKTKSRNKHNCVVTQ